MSNRGCADRNNLAAFFQSASFAYLILTLTTFFFAANHVLGRGVRAEIPPVGLSFWRWFLGGVLLLPFVWRGLYASAPVVRAHLLPLSFLGCLMIGSTTLLLVALNFTTAVNASLINATQPVLTVFLAWLFVHEKLKWPQPLGVAAGLAGVVVMIAKADWQVIAGMQINGGDIIALVGILGFAVYAINIYRIPRELTPAESLFVIICSGCTALTPFYLAETMLYKAVPITARSLAVILFIALTVSISAMLMWNAGNRILGPNRAGMFINLVPVFAAVLAITCLGEQLFLYHLVGAGLISSGIYLVLCRHTE